MVRNRIGWRDRLAHMRGAPVVLDLRRFDAALGEIGRIGDALRTHDDAQLEARARQLRPSNGADGALAAIRPAFYALARELAARRIGLRPFDVQIVAALALDAGAVVEMQTGEGKTLTAVLPAALNALAGRGVHVLTFNDYLARRDAEWMGPLYRSLGVSVDFVQQGMPRERRQRAYAADVTYVTAKEAGFDHLRDGLAGHTSELVHRPFHMALIDEADSILIDEARVPLVIAGSVSERRASPAALSGLVASFAPGVHYDSDEYGRDVELTDAGIDYVERTLGCGRLHDERNLALLTDLNCALHARALLRRDVDYLVRDGRIGIIDEHTGRVVADRHWPDGLQAALEAKEGIEAQPDGRILGSITLQHFARAYPRLCGMTGTARAAAAELDETYGLQVVVIPTNKPPIRIDNPDRVFADQESKIAAVVDEIVAEHATGRPLLVGTVSVEASEHLTARLRAAGIAGEVLNARNDEAEAAIVARAGVPGAVTISTNMAGRGTDIKLEGPASSHPAELGGLYVIGTSRHESERVDQQLRGRAGRQGDPGESRFFVSLEDETLVKYGIHSLLAGRFTPPPDGQPITHPVARAEIARAQRIVENQNLEIRRTLARYSAPLDEHRVLLMERRRAVLERREDPGIWSSAPELVTPLIDAAGIEAVREAERVIFLACLDRAWADHLALSADLREGIHLVSLGGLDPLTRYTTELSGHFRSLEDTIDEAVLDALKQVRSNGTGLELPAAVVKGPSSTWTYLISDDPFRNQIGMLLTGPGKSTFAIGAALMSLPLLVFWGLVDRYLRRRPARRG